MSSATDHLASALRQTKPFSSPETGAYLALMRVASRFDQEVSDLLKPNGITPTQYNVLRVLRGSEPSGMACGAVLERLVTRDPDITRLLDRLERLGLATRSRDTQDRRVVVTRITTAGLELLAALDEPVTALHQRQLSHLGPEGVQSLSSLLDEVLATER